MCDQDDANYCDHEIEDSGMIEESSEPHSAAESDEPDASDEADARKHAKGQRRQTASKAGKQRDKRDFDGLLLLPRSEGFRKPGAASERQTLREKKHDGKAAARREAERAEARDAEEERRVILLQQQSTGARPACKACRNASRPCGHVRWDDENQQWLFFKKDCSF